MTSKEDNVVKKKKVKLLICVIVCLMMLLLVGSAQAAGVETWYYGGNGWNEMFVTNYNITPVKTIGDSGDLVVSVFFEGARNGIDEPEWYSPVNLTVEIREAYTGVVLASRVIPEEYFYESVPVFAYGLPEGKQIQLYFDISSQYNAPGAYRKGYISYEAAIW